MEELTFGEQVKIVLGRKGMTIKALAREIEEKTGRKMSRQNLTQRLGRDNFQEQDMRMIAEILGCPFHLSILSGEEPLSQTALQKSQAKRQTQPAPKEETKHVVERDMTVGEFVDLHRRLDELEREKAAAEQEAAEREAAEREAAEREAAKKAAAEQEAAEQEAAEREAAERKAAEREAAGEAAERKAAEREAAGEAAEREAAGKDAKKAAAEKEASEKETVEKETSEKAAAEAVKEGTAGPADRQPLPAAETGERVQEHAKENTVSAGPAKPADSRKAEPESRVSEAGAPHIEVILKESKPEKSSVSGGRDVQQKELRKRNTTPAPASLAQEANEEPAGEINPYTGREYETDSVRSHPSRIGYVQVYDRSIHGWTDMTEWAFLGYQERKKALLGRDYKPPVYLD